MITPDGLGIDAMHPQTGINDACGGVSTHRAGARRMIDRVGAPSEVGSEANDSRRPVDDKISRGGKDETLIEMKLAKNTGLERNLEKQLPIYQAASEAKNGIKVIIFFSAAEKTRVEGILDRLGILDHEDVVLIDARNDNKPSGSKA